MNEIVASMTHANKKYGKKAVLRDVTIQATQKNILGLIGPSGAGKTTAIKCLMGMEKLDSGKATLFGTPMPNRHILQRVGYMGQDNALYENLTAKENLIFFGNLMGVTGKELNESIEKSMKLVQLSNHLEQIVSTFSGGMKRRLSLAITLVSNPDLLVLDEPTVGIDPVLRLSIWEELRSLTRKGKTIIMTTHVMDEAEKCDEIGLIIDGNVFTVGTPIELKEQFSVDSIEEVFIKAEVSKK